MEVVVSMVKAKFGLFDVEVEEATREAAMFGQAGFGVAPERFDPVDVVAPACKLVPAVVNAEVAFVAQVDEAVVALPTVGVDDALVSHTALDDGLQRVSRAIVEHVGEDFAAAFEDTDDGHLTTCASPPFAPHTPRAKGAFGDFNLAFERSLSQAFVRNANPDRQHMTVDARAMQAHDLSDLDGFQIERKEAVELAKLLIRKSGTFAVSVGH